MDPDGAVEHGLGRPCLERHRDPLHDLGRVGADPDERGGREVTSEAPGARGSPTRREEGRRTRGAAIQRREKGSEERPDIS